MVQIAPTPVDEVDHRR